MIYLDHAATTPVRREALEAMWPYLTGEFGNPSSHHAVGQTAATALAVARRQVAAWLGCRPGEVTFTSGGTEANNLIIKGIALANPRGRHLITSPIEHESVLESVDYLHRHHGFTVSMAPVDAYGRVDLDQLTRIIRPDTTLVSIALANNEIGTIQPVAEVAVIAHAAGAVMHTDAVQAAGWLDVTLAGLGVDAISVSGHKLGAPKGVGVAAIRGKILIEPLVHGGGQEKGRRSGTENVAGAVAFAAAVRAGDPTRATEAAQTTSVRDAFIADVVATVPGAMLTGHPTHRLPGTASFCFPGTSGEGVLLQLEERGVIVSSGSACAAGSDDPSPVLLACGVPPTVAQTAVRFTLGHHSTAEEATLAAAALRASVAAVTALGASATPVV